jgi:DNA polymerase III delta prime subunit
MLILLQISGYNVNMRAYLIVGGNPSSRDIKIRELFSKIKPTTSPDKDPDTQIIQDDSIGIEAIRDLARIVSLKPFASLPKVGIIQANNLTFEAQTAFLKTLEEPPGDAIFILHSPNTNLLLSTIISRCQVINLPPESEVLLCGEEKQKQTAFLEQMLKASPSERIVVAEKEGITTKEVAEKFCQIQLILWREKLLESKSLKTIATIRQIQKTIRHLKANVNPKLAIENLILSY